MASPFRIFRKYTKTLLVVFGVMLMFVFVIGDALIGYMGGGPGGPGDGGIDPNAVAVSWNGGSLTNAELYELTARRQIAKGFALNVFIEGQRDAYMAGVDPKPLTVEPVFLQDTPESPRDGVEQDVVQTRLFADAARKAGMKISDESIIQYLDELGRGNVSRDDMRKMLSQVQVRGMRVSIEFVLDAIREQMLARNFLASHQFAFETVTPQERWEDWLKVNDRVVIEAAALPTESFVAEVADPTDAQLTKFFDEHKNRVPQPDPQVAQAFALELPWALPGFAIPRKVEAQFIQADYDEYLAKLETEVTDDEIAKFYEQNKDQFIKADTSLFEDSGKKPAEDGKAATEPATEPAETTPPAEAPPAETPPTDDAAPDAAADPDASGEAAPPNETNAEQPATDIEQPAADNEEAPADSAPEQPPSDEAPPAEESGEPAPADNDQSAAPARGVFRTVAFLQEEKADDESTPPPADAPAEESPAVEAPPAEQDGAESAEQPATSEPASTEPPTTEAAPRTTPSTDPASSNQDPASNAAAPAAPTTAPAAPAAPKPVEYQPLEEVRDIIRRELAERRTAERLAEIMKTVHGEVDGEFSRYMLSADADSKKAPAGLADLAPLAAKHGLKHGRTGPVSGLELRELPVGKSGSSETGHTVVQSLFLDSDVQLFQPLSTVDLDGNRFIVVKIADTPGRVPKLDEVKPQVVQAWKMQQAAELARKSAEALAKEAEQAAAPLTEFFANQQPAREVVRTDPFSLLTGGDVALVGLQQQLQPFRLSQPDGIVAAGPEFLEKVFELKQGNVAAILNHDHSIAYVVRVVEHQDTPDQLRTAFLSEVSTWPGSRLMTSGHARAAASRLVQSVRAGADLKWERTPDQVERDEEEEKQSDAG